MVCVIIFPAGMERQHTLITFECTFSALTTTTTTRTMCGPERVGLQLMVTVTLGKSDFECSG